MEEYSREPCPYRILDDTGSAFSMGLLGGSIFHSIAGFRNAATNQKLSGMIREVRIRSPVTGVQFAAWGGMFSTIDCGLVAWRKKEDPLNSIAAGTLTGGILAVRSGPAVMLGSAALGGVILGMIEGVGMLLSRYMGATMHDPTQVQDMEDPRNLPSKKEGSNTVSVNFDENGSPTSSSSATPFGIPSLHM